MVEHEKYHTKLLTVPRSSALVTLSHSAEIESISSNGRRQYGSLPFFSNRTDILSHFSEEARYFSRHYEAGKDLARDTRFAEGILLFEMKFGKRLSDFTEEILASYPPRSPITAPGQEISVFGLSGSGKSTAVSALRAVLGQEAIAIDSDTVRFNLLAKMVRDCDKEADLTEIRKDLLNFHGLTPRGIS